MSRLKWRALLVVVGLACSARPLSALIVEGRWYHGHKVQCVHGGAWFYETRLGVNSRARGYEQVFTGTVLSVSEISDTDRQLQIKPDEVFRGERTETVTATVNQACITPNNPEIKAGDEWVFYLRTKRYLYPYANPPYITTDGLMVVFDSPSKPLAQAEHDICLLRQHSDEDESCGAGPNPPTLCGTSYCLEGPIASPFPPPALPGQMPTAIFQFGSLKAHIATPPEFKINEPALNFGTLKTSFASH